MHISLIQPLSNGWQRMKTALFQPFDIGKWFILGFTAFLAGLSDGPGGSGFGNKLDKHDFDGIEDLQHIADEVSYWFSNNPGWAMLIFAGIILVIGLILLFTWLSSRGAFMFLDNVVKNSAEVRLPWNEYRKQGNSIFLWRMAFGILSFIFIIYMVLFILAGLGLFYFASFGEVSWLSLMSAVVFFIVMLVAISFISMLTNNFVIPIMYRHNLTVLQGWQTFWEILKNAPGSFILYGLFLLLLHAIIFAIIMVVGFMTCCFGFILVMLPYISSVVLLPVSFTFRAFSVAYLEQFGEDFQIFPKEDAENSAETTATNE